MASGNPEKDWRSLALLLLGLGLLAVQLAGPGRPPWTGDGQRARAEADPALIWLAGSNIAEGLYQVPKMLLPPLADNFAGLYRHFGLYTPDDSSANKLLPAGLQLEDHGQPSIIPYPARLDSLFFRPIPINRADEELLATIPGIGPQLTARIIARRQERGDFRQPADLLEVPGIGPAKLEQLRKYLSFE